MIEVEYKGESVSGVFGWNRDWVNQGLLVTSVASTWVEWVAVEAWTTGVT